MNSMPKRINPIKKTNPQVKYVYWPCILLMVIQPTCLLLRNMGESLQVCIPSRWRCSLFSAIKLEVDLYWTCLVEGLAIYLKVENPWIHVCFWWNEELSLDHESISILGVRVKRVCKKQFIPIHWCKWDVNMFKSMLKSHSLVEHLPDKPHQTLTL